MRRGGIFSAPMMALFCHATHVLMLMYFVQRKICFSVLLLRVTLRCLNDLVFSVDAKEQNYKKVVPYGYAR